MNHTKRFLFGTIASNNQPSTHKEKIHMWKWDPSVDLVEYRDKGKEKGIPVKIMEKPPSNTIKVSSMLRHFRELDK